MCVCVCVCVCVSMRACVRACVREMWKGLFVSIAVFITSVLIINVPGIFGLFGLTTLPRPLVLPYATSDLPHVSHFIISVY